jgi:hypothetical protein
MMSSIGSPGKTFEAILPRMKIIRKIKRYKAKAQLIPINFPTRPRIITVTAEQGIYVARNPVMNLSLWVSMIRQERQAGTLHPNPNIKGMEAFPWIPILCIKLSNKKVIRAK